MSFGYQSLLGDSQIDIDLLTTDELDARIVKVSQNLTVGGLATVNSLMLPNGAHDGWVMTSDPYGVASWQADPNTSLNGDVTGLLTANTVVKVGTSTALNIHTAEVLANAATDANTVSTIVKRE